MKRVSLFARGCALLALLSCATTTAAPAQTARLVKLDLPAQPLAQAVNHIGQAVGISVLVQGDSAGKTSPALRGEMTLDHALGQVLAASGADYRFTRQGGLVVTLPVAAPSPDTVLLEPVVITATGSAQGLPDAPASMTVIKGEALRRRPGRSLAEALRDVPGLSVAAPGRDDGTPITMRGMGQPYVLFMVDGKPLGASEDAAYNGYGLGTKAGFLPPPSVVERVEIIRGPMSSLYGSAALGGVVHVITRPVPESWSGRLDLGLTGGDGSTTQAGFALGGPLLRERLGLLLYGSRIGWHDADAGSRAPRAGNRTNLGGRLSWTPVEGQVLDLDLWQSRLHFDAALRGAPRAGSSEVRNRGASLTHRLRWGEAETVSFLLRERTDFHIGNDSGHKALTFGTRTALPLGAHALTFGFEHRREDTRHDPDRLPDSASTRPSRWHQALYAEGQFALSPELTLTLGLRHDRDQRYGATLTPRLYAVWHATPALTLRGGVGAGYRVPALKQADDDVWEPSGGDGMSRDRGNSALRPERSTNYELGLAWQADSGPSLAATLFHSRFRDHITRRDLCRTPLGQAPACALNGGVYEAVTQYVNADGARLRGAEIAFDLPLGDADLAITYTWSDSLITRGRDAGRPFHNLPRHELGLALDWRVGEPLTLWTRGRYRSRAEALGRSVETPAHVLFDLGLDYRLSDRTTVSLGVFNLGNVSAGEHGPLPRRLSLMLNAGF
ncbi:TonB-dependent receptor domain-containing protein [Paracoccus aminovorans]|uniref:TonB-dependent receptor domain-containing protein n=1 Tax=Paracoccus aminovorans TaxID=34004 RepID=UPI002B261270|nr:TonB-dependent receptor [Paracoccus aminovorans]